MCSEMLRRHPWNRAFMWGHKNTTGTVESQQDSQFPSGNFKCPWTPGRGSWSEFVTKSHRGFKRRMIHSNLQFLARHSGFCMLWEMMRGGSIYQGETKITSRPQSYLEMLCGIKQVNHPPITASFIMNHRRMKLESELPCTGRHGQACSKQSCLKGDLSQWAGF